MARKRGMGKIGNEAAAETDKELAGEEAALILRTCTAMSSLRPNIGDKAAFDQLVQVVQDCTQRNISVAEFQARVHALGEGAIRVAKEVVRLVS